MARSKSSASRSKRFPAWAAVLFFGVFALFGVAGTWFMLIQPLSLLWQARSWDAKDCEVLSSQVQSHSSDDGYTYSIDIEYRYEVDGRTYTSDRYHFMGGSSSGYEGKAEVVERHPPGAVVTCYVDPDDPTQAVLNRSFSWVYLFGLFPLLFLAAGVGGFYLWLGTRESSKPSAPSPPSTLEPGFREAPEIGPKVLEPSMGPVGKVVGMLFIALFWNGIVSVFVVIVIQAWREGGGFETGCLTLFLVPFVLIGLGLIVGVFSSILALANPRPRLVLDPASPRLGDSATLLRWEFTGAVRRMRKLELSLVGKEEARYRRGTNTHTDHHTFYAETVYETVQTMNMRQGSVSVTIPGDQMHSFEASNNEIQWTLTVRGDIARWPDVSEDFPIRIRPAEVE